MSDLIVTKSNELIDSYIFNTTELELQILNYAVATLNPRWENQNVVFRISISDLVRTFNMNSNNAYKVYKDALIRLMDKKYTFKLSDGTERTENLIIRIDKPTTNNWLEFKFNEYISQHLSNLKKLFTSYEIKHIAKFKSRYSFILYEAFKMNLEKNKNLNQYYWAEEISIKKLREKLDLVGKYKAFNLLRINVLDKAKFEINKYTDILVDFEIKKTGRTPTSIVFKVKRKDGNNSDIKDRKISKLEQSIAKKEIGKRKKLINKMDKEELAKFMEERQENKSKEVIKSNPKIKQEKSIEDLKSKEADQEKQDVKEGKKGFLKKFFGFT